jgi:DNA-binding SARP family transcriptional activator/ABC-type oligopeptide transport system substrate-binding subunit/outer membrane protein assembly factor BamB
VEFRVLGPLQVSQDGRVIPLGGAQQRAVLAILLLHANRVVSADAIAAGLWGERPPASAANTVQGYISRLRKLLASGDGDLIERSPPGYVLRVEPKRVDTLHFGRLVRDAAQAHASGKLERAAGLLREALALWRGPALADVEFNSFVELERRRLEELRLAALEERAEIDLALGRHADLIAELELLVGEHPFREGFRRQLMVALYRCGRQAEALQVYQQARQTLVEELGLEPGQSLRELEQAILRQDASLSPPREPAREAGTSPAPPKRRSSRLVLLIGLACAIGAALLLGLLLPRVMGGSTASAAFRPGTVLLDLKTRRQIAFLPPSELASPRFPLYSGGHFWVLNSAPASFVELDPASGKVLTRFALPDGVKHTRTNRPFAVDGPALWVGAGDDLVKVDTGLGEEVERFDLDEIVGKEGAAEGVAVGEGLVWVGRDVGRGQVVALDPDTRKLRYRFDDLVHHVDLAYGGHVVWAADGQGVDVIDPSTHTVTQVRDVETTDPFFGVFSPGNSVAAGGGFGWTTDSPKGLVHKIDRNGRIVATAHTGLGATGAYFRNGVLWVRNVDEGTVAGIDAITGKKKAVYRFGHPVGAEVVGGGVLLAALQPTTENRIGTLTGNVVRLFSQEGALEAGEPALNWQPAAAQIEFATCAKLLNYPDSPGPAGVRLQPEVAAAMPTLSRDKRTYTFTVRPGYRFSPPSRQRVTAQTFRASIERALSPKLEAGLPLGWSSPGAGYVQEIHGEQAFRNGSARHISGLRARGNRLSITLTKPSPDFLQRLAMPAFCPVPVGTPSIPGAANRTADSTGDYSMPSAGPYYVANWRSDEYVILKRNPNYHGPRPHALDAIALREGVDAAAALERVRHGGWDGIISSGRASSGWLDPLLEPNGPVARQYGKRSSNREQYIATAFPETGFIVLNSVRGPFADRAMRRAAALAVDRAAVAAVWGELPSDQLLPPGAPGFHDRHFYSLHAPALRKASALMHGRRRTVVMAITANSDPSLQEGRLVRAELARIGLRVKLKAFDDPDAAAAEPGAKIDIKDQGLIGGYPDGAAFLRDVFSIPVPASWLSSDVKRAVERVNRLSGSERRSAAAALADRLVMRDVPVIPYGNRADGEFLAPTLGCRVFPPLSGGVDLAALCLTKRL